MESLPKPSLASFPRWQAVHSNPPSGVFPVRPCGGPEENPISAGVAARLKNVIRIILSKSTLAPLYIEVVTCDPATPAAKAFLIPLVSANGIGSVNNQPAADV